MIYNPWELKRETNSFSKTRNYALAVFSALGIYAAATGIVDIAKDLEKRYEKYKIPEYKIYDTKAAVNRMNNAIDMWNAGECLELRDCYKLAGEEK